MRAKKILSKKNKDSPISFAKICGKILIFYLVTVGQVVASAHEIRKTSRKEPNTKRPGALGEHTQKNYPQLKQVEQQKSPSIKTFQNRDLSQAHPGFKLILSQDQLEKKFRESITPYERIMPAGILTDMGIQLRPQPHGLRYDRDILKLKQLSHTALSSLYRKRSLTDPFYSILLCKDYTQNSKINSYRIAELFLFQAMLQARTPDEIILVNKAYTDLTTLDMPDNLREALFNYRELLITEYSVSNPGLCKKVLEGGTIYTRHSDPELFEFHSIVIKMDHHSTLEYLNRNPSVKPRLEKEAAENQNEFASGDLALLAMSSKDYILALVLDIQRVLQYRKSSSVIRLYQLALRRLEQLIDSPSISFRDIHIIRNIRFLDAYYTDKKLTENEQLVFSKFSNLLDLAERKVKTKDSRNSYGEILAYIIPLSVILWFIYMIYNFNKNVGGQDNQKKESSDNERKPNINKGSLKRRNVFFQLKEVSIQKLEVGSDENSETIKRQEYLRCINRLKTYSKMIPELVNVKKYLEGKRAILAEKLNEFSKNNTASNSVISKKIHIDNSKDIEKINSQQKRSIKHNIKLYDEYLASISIFANTLSECENKNNTIDDLETLLCTISSLSQTYENIKKWMDDIALELEIKSNAKQKDYQSKIKMLDYAKNRAMILVPSLANQVCQQLSCLKSVAEESKASIDFKELELASNNLLNALSNFTVIVSVDYSQMDEIKFEEHVQQVIEAERILDPSHPLQNTLEVSYRNTESSLYNSKLIVSASDELNNCDDSVQSFSL